MERLFPFHVNSNGNQGLYRLLLWNLAIQSVSLFAYVFVSLAAGALAVKLVFGL
jgi:hypothetical protein